MYRFVFMISDGTGITAESLGNSLLTQFEQLEFKKQTYPYIDTLEKAEEVVQTLNKRYEETKIKPIAFMTLVNTELSNYIKKANACVLDLFNTFIAPLEYELQTKSSYTVGKTHGLADTETYAQRIAAINYTLAHDDGLKIQGYDKADVILVGVSRSGKTPSCLYMALQFGILAANYPFTEEGASTIALPKSLRPYKNKLFGLTIDPDRLEQIRTERRPNSRYASTHQCRQEVSEIEAMYKRENIPFLNSTRYSIEEIATKIMAKANIKRKL